MAKNTRKLNIVVSVRDQTKKALGGIRARVKRFSQATAKAIGRAFKVGLAAAAVAFGVFTANVKKQFDEIDQLAKDAFRFGVAIENIRGLELAGKLAGLSLSEMGTILRDTARRVSEAAQGTGEAQDALKELGLDAERLNLMPVEEQLDTITKALGNVENKNDRVRLAYDIMGRSGVKGLSLIGVSLRSSIQETEQLGTALNDEIAGNVQNANDELTRMKEAFKGIVQVAVSELAPRLTVIFKGVKQFLIEARLGIQAIPLTVEAELLKIRKHVTDFERFMLDNKAGRFLLGEQAIGDLRILSQDDEKRIKEIEGLRNNLTRQAGQLSGASDPFSPVSDGGEDRPSDTRPKPAGMPGIIGGRLLTGAAQSSAERLAEIQKAADNKRAKEAGQAAKDRKAMIDLLRSAVQNPNAQLGGLLQ